ncbi:MAG: hypothetical protein WCH34_05075 [Bacteroidota bacterium]
MEAGQFGINGDQNKIKIAVPKGKVPVRRYKAVSLKGNDGVLKGNDGVPNGKFPLPNRNVGVWNRNNGVRNGNFLSQLLQLKKCFSGNNTFIKESSQRMLDLIPEIPKS